MSLMPWRPFQDLGEVFNEDDWFLPLISAKERAKDKKTKIKSKRNKVVK